MGERGLPVASKKIVVIGNLATRRSFSTNRSCLDRRQGTHLPDPFINRNDRIDWSAAEEEEPVQCTIHGRHETFCIFSPQIY